MKPTHVAVLLHAGILNSLPNVWTAAARSTLRMLCLLSRIIPTVILKYRVIRAHFFNPTFTRFKRSSVKLFLIIHFRAAASSIIVCLLCNIWRRRDSFIARGPTNCDRFFFPLARCGVVALCGLISISGFDKLLGRSISDNHLPQMNSHAAEKEALVCSEGGRDRSSTDLPTLRWTF